MARHADATHVIKPDRDPLQGTAFCTVCNRDLTDDELAAVREEQT